MGEAGIAASEEVLLMNPCMSGGFLDRAIGRPQELPIDVGAQVFAADGASSGALNAWAVVGRHIAATVPVIYHLRNNANRSRQRCLRSCYLIGFFECLHDARNNKHVGNASQQVVCDIFNKCFMVA